MFPRHVLEYIVSGAGTHTGPAAVANLATSHESVTIMFMDIIGELNHDQRGRIEYWRGLAPPSTGLGMNTG